MNRLYEAFQRINRTKRVEDSVALRAAILATVMVAVVAVVASGAAAINSAVIAMVLLPIGAWVSHRRRGKDNTAIKLLLTIGAAYALMRFFGELRLSTSIDDTREPLANLFLAVQVLHGFDLPARRDLQFTLASSLALIALAGASSHDMQFAFVLLPYVALTAICSALLQHSTARERADDVAEREQRRALATPPQPVSKTPVTMPLAVRAVAATGAGLLKATAPAVLAGLLVFTLLPRTDGIRLGYLPFQGFPGLAVAAGAGVLNPGLPVEGQQGQGPMTFNPSAYFGFAEHVDLRTVGQLSDAPVMRVRAELPRFWRGMVFDTYDGTAWTRTPEDIPPPTYGTPVSVRTSMGQDSQVRDLVQTFEIITETPNLIFAAADPADIFIAGASVHDWQDGTITTPNLQEAGTIYSVISHVDAAPAETLRGADGEVDPDLLERYTQLPDTLPQRVHDLAAELTAGATTYFEKAEAIEDWIAANTEYTLGVPPPRDGVDVVDHFLFETRKGWCEPIASSMVALLRSSGVPARFATGFAPGRRNAFTGWFEVKVSDAHAWVEVYLPGHGWHAFDPTGRVPQAVEVSAVPRFALIELISWVGRAIAAVIPQPVKDVFLGVLRWAFSHLWNAVALLMAVTMLFFAWRLLRRRTKVAASARAADPFGRLAALLGRHGVGRDAWQTPREYVRRVRLRRPDVPGDPLARLLAWEETRRYAPQLQPPPIEQVEEALREVEASLEQRELVGAGRS